MEPTTAVNTFDDDVYENMTYDERRNFNLARNREMMNLLFAGGNPLATQPTEDQTDGPPTSSVLVDTVPNEKDAESLVKTINTGHIFCRERETLRLVQYLDKNLFPSQPMLVYGPVATGKSLLCRTALAHITSSPHMTVACTAVTTTKRFIQRIWFDAFSSISNFNKTQLNMSLSFEENRKIKSVSTFSELVDKMASLMFCQAHFLKQINTKKVPGLIIMIDDIDKADELEEGLSRRLLCLNELCHPLLKVLAIGRSLPRSLTSCILLQLLPYSNEQLLSILCQKHNCVNEHNTTDKNSSQINLSLLNSDFKMLCEQALPHFTLTSRRVDEAWTMMEELFVHRLGGVKSSRYVIGADDSSSSSDGFSGGSCGRSSSKSSIHDDIYIDRSNCESESERNSRSFGGNIVSGGDNSSSISSSSSSSGGSGNSNTSCGTGDRGAVSLLSGSKRPLHEDIKALVLRPAVHMPGFSQSLSSSSTQQSSNLPIDMQSYHGIEWFNHLPMKAKALALSAFLASRNPPATDRSTFGQASKGRRKKTRGDGSDGSTPSGFQPQSFSIERLLSIYHQVLPSLYAAIAHLPKNKYRRIQTVGRGEVDKKISVFSVDNTQKHQNTKNETMLYAMVNTLLKKRVLIAYTASVAGTKAVKMSDSNVHLMYLCTLHMNRAEELADSINFPLKNYLCC